ncbi:hypothetical protein EDC04DRAFT_2632592 [Pisolithus marmoratus]|nr:hypothetical protein EDC04DRAFT_2632592 [Pisolithus marmoratus]
MPPVKLAIVGGGPSAFYVASRLLSLLPNSGPSSLPLRVHMFDRAWAPHGLVRYGVAPDHPEVKNCTHKFDAAALDPRFRFFGHVNIDCNGLPPIPSALSIPISSLFSNYTHLLFATGCPLPTLHPAIPPSRHCIPALSFVHWYTRHPSQPPPPAIDKFTHLTLIGNGNVSLDIARILLTNPSVLEKYDLPKQVLDVLSRSAIKHVSIIGRRGPLQAAFTNKELRELMNLPEASMVPIDSSVLVPPDGTTLTRQQRRTLELLQKGSQKAPGTTPKSWSLEFYRSPTSLSSPSSASPADMSQLTLAHTRVDPVTGRAVLTGETSTLSTSVVVTSLGFRAERTATFRDPSVNHLRTRAGRVLSANGTAIPNIYASGWAANGAKGVLASTMMDAYAVADTILSDITPGPERVQTTAASEYLPNENSADLMLNPQPHPEEPPKEVVQGIKDGTVTQYEDWKAVDAEEIRKGEVLGKERERMNWEDAKAFLASRG